MRRRLAGIWVSARSQILNTKSMRSTCKISVDGDMDRMVSWSPWYIGPEADQLCISEVLSEHLCGRFAYKVRNGSQWLSLLLLCGFMRPATTNSWLSIPLTCCTFISTDSYFGTFLHLGSPWMDFTERGYQRTIHDSRPTPGLILISAYSLYQTSALIKWWLSVSCCLQSYPNTRPLHPARPGHGLKVVSCGHLQCISATCISDAERAGRASWLDDNELL